MIANAFDEKYSSIYGIAQPHTDLYPEPEYVLEPANPTSPRTLNPENKPSLHHNY